LPNEFEKVLNTYSDFGDVWKQPFREWGELRWRELFEANIVSPKIKTLAYLQEGEHEESDIIIKNLEKYLNTERPRNGYPEAFIYAIPVHSTKKRILEEVSYALDMYKKSSKYNYKPKLVIKPKYELQITRSRDSSLQLYHKVVTVKAQRPNWKLWEIATYLKICKVHTDVIIESEKNIGRKDRNATEIKYVTAVHEKQIVNATVSRYIKNALLLSENAARGKFPCMDKIDSSKNKGIKFNYHNLSELLKSQK